jgi:hypothetical protein
LINSVASKAGRTFSPRCRGPAALSVAHVCCRNALAIDPAHANTLDLMGLLAIETDRCDHAVDWLAPLIGEACEGDCTIQLRPELWFAAGPDFSAIGHFEQW